MVQAVQQKYTSPCIVEHITINTDLNYTKINGVLIYLPNVLNAFFFSCNLQNYPFNNSTKMY